MRGLVIIIVLTIGACTGDKFVAGDGGGTGADGGTTYWESGPVPGPERPVCPGKEVTVTGVVLAPNGTDPVQGATVFIPAAVPELFPPAVACEVCGTLTAAGNLWTTTSAYNGHFTLDAVCPKKWPLVMQNGRFRRLVYIDVPEGGGKLELTAEQTRLPKRNQEFDVVDAVPKIAVAAGDFDSMECVLRKIGLDDKAIDLYDNGTDVVSPTPLPKFASLVNDLNKMKSYNIIFINCTQNTYETELTKASVRQNIAQYIQSGGRFYVTDWSYAWIEQVPELAGFIDFEPGASGTAPETPDAAKIGAGGLQVMGTLKDPDLARWLGQFPGTVTAGQAQIVDFLGGWVMMREVSKDAKVWVEGQVRSQDNTVSGIRPLTVTFNFENCGKALFSSYHTEGREGELFPESFPAYCTSTTSSPQDRILEYLIFDIANCVKPIE